ncbi:unnamed protein product, partial [Polarella glacialis]
MVTHHGGSSSSSGRKRPLRAKPQGGLEGQEQWVSRFATMSPCEAFSWLVHPMSVEDFLEQYWEKKPLHLSRGEPSRFGDLLPESVIEQQLRSREGLTFGQDINVARCGADGLQVMCNGTGRADASAVPRKVKEESCSVQVVHPQRFSAPLAALMARLEAHVGCLWGANSFRTPSGGMGFKAHHDE